MARDFSRKELKRQDEFLSTATRLLNWAMQRRRALGIAALAALAAVAVLAGLHSYRARQEQNAAAQLAVALRLYDAPVVTGGEEPAAAGADEHAARAHRHFPSEQAKYEAVVAALEPVVRTYGDTPSGRMAAFYLGSALAELGRGDDAVAAWLRAAEGSPPLVRAMARYRLAEYYLQEGRSQEALTLLGELVDRPPGGFPVQEALAAQARAYEAAGDRRAAMMTYEKLAEQHPSSVYAAPARRQAEELAAALGVDLSAESD